MDPHPFADEICAKLRATGYQAYLVGGCVRDILLGREPLDYDVSTDAHPDAVQRLFPQSVDVGAKFGVIKVFSRSEEEGTPANTIEVATFRRDISYSDGRHPTAVEFTESAQEDVRRRDFTINGLLLEPQTNQILDYVDGRADLAAGIVRAIGDPARRFAEDKLRILRAVRFAARFGFQIESQTLTAAREQAGHIIQVSSERTREELTRILTEGHARRGFELLDDVGLLTVLLPDVARMKGVEQPPQYHPEGDAWIHTRMMLQHLATHSSATLAWGVLLHDVGKPPTFKPPVGPEGRIRFDGHAEVGTRMAEFIARNLKFSNDDLAQVSALVANHMRFKDVRQMRPATLKKFVRLPKFDEHLELHRLDCLASHGSLDAYEFVRQFLADTPPEEVRPPRLITGDDLKELGFRPGPRFKEILNAVEEAQLDGRFSDRDAALEFARSIRES